MVFIAPEWSINEYFAFVDSEFNCLYGIFLAIWYTVLIETWKKKEAHLMFEWDLNILKEKDVGSIRKGFKYVYKYDSDINIKVKVGRSP